MKMKKTILLLATLMFFSSSAYAVVSAKEILKRLVAGAVATEGVGNQILFAQIDNIKKGQTNLLNYTLTSGTTYTIMAFGDEQRVQDIDLSVLDRSYNVIKKDNSSKNIAIVQVTPSRTGAYKIRVSAYRMNRSDAFYGIMISRNQ